MPKDTYSRISPPRPMNCFLLYRNDMQKEIVAKCKGANHRDISKIIAKWWRESDEKLKKSYRLRAMKEKEEHRKKYPGYKYCPKKKAGTKRGYTRRNIGTIFTSRTEENNKLMEIIYMGERSLKATKSEGMPNSPENKYAPKVLKREESLKTVKIEENDSHALFTERPKSGSLSPPAIKKSAKVTHDSKHRSRYSSAPLILSNQDPWYARRSLSPENSFSPYSSNSVAYGSLYKSPSPPASYYAMPYMRPAVSSFNTNSQDPFYAAYYDLTCQTFIYSSNYINQSYAQPLHPNISNSSNIFFANHSVPQYTTPSAAYHASMNYVHRRPSYSTPVSSAAYEYEKACDGCIDPCLLGMP